MKRPCESCRRRPGVRVVAVKGARFLVCASCAPTVKGEAA